MSRIIFLLAIAAIFNPGITYAQSKSKFALTTSGPTSGLPIITTPGFGSILRTDTQIPNSTASDKLMDVNNGIPIASPTTIGSGTLNSSSILFTTPSPGLNGAF